MVADLIKVYVVCWGLAIWRGLFYEMEDKPKMSKENTRTVAFQVPEELFERFKEYLSKHGIKQNAFFLDCIQRALAEDAEAAANE